MAPSGQVPFGARLAFVSLLAAAAMMQAPAPAAPRIEGMVREAEHLAHFESFAPARLTLHAALRAAERRSDARLTALCLDRLGSVIEFEGDSAAGMAHHERALALARRIGNRTLAASIQASIGLGHWRRSEYSSALSALHEALATQEQAGDESGRARTLDFIGRVHFKRADYPQATRYYREAAAIEQRLGDHRALSIVLEDLGDVELEQGFFPQALHRYEQALAARKAIADAAGEAYVLHLIGRAYLLQGAYRDALVWFERGRAVARGRGDIAGEALALYHAAIAHNGLADANAALRLFADALALKERLGDRRQQAWILARMGDAHARRRDFGAAVKRYHHATRIWEAIGDPRGIATGLEKTARLELARGRHEESLTSLHRAIAILSVSQPAFLPSALAGAGEAYASAGDKARALAYGRRAVDVARRGRNDEMRWVAARSLGRIQRQFGRRADALASYRQSLDIIETLRGRVLASPDVRADFLEGKQAVYAETVELLVESGRAGEALEIAERSRARAFLDLLSGRRDLPSRAESIDRVAPTAAPTLDQGREEVRRRGATVIEYFCAANRLFIWVLAPNGIVSARTVDISRRDLANLIRDLRSSMVLDHASSETPQLLRRLHQLLIEPVLDLLPASKDRLVTIVPHGPLFLVSFAALIDRAGVYLVERHTISYIPSISVLRHTGRNQDRAIDRQAPRVIAIGNPVMPASAPGPDRLVPLPGAEREARAITALYPQSRAMSLIGSDARERVVRELAPHRAIIHIATHAVVFDGEPMQSYLALAPDSGGEAGDAHGDGLLKVAEVFGLDLHADLVTLSACNTGLGHVSGDGVIGLSRAFIYAGAATVLVSLWRVADTVATIQMTRFYEEMLRTDGNKAASLAAAQRAVIADLRAGRIKAPSGDNFQESALLWAPFVLIGEAR